MMLALLMILDANYDRIASNYNNKYFRICNDDKPLSWLLYYYSSLETTVFWIISHSLSLLMLLLLLLLCRLDMISGVMMSCTTSLSLHRAELKLALVVVVVAVRLFQRRAIWSTGWLVSDSLCVSLLMMMMMMMMMMIAVTETVQWPLHNCTVQFERFSPTLRCWWWMN